jgi:hypothetical protein
MWFNPLLKFALWYEDRSKRKVLKEGYEILSRLRAPGEKSAVFLRRGVTLKSKLVPFLNDAEVKILSGAIENELSKIKNENKEDLNKKMLEFNQTMENIISELRKERDNS